MVGRQTPLLAVIVPLILVGMVDGMRGIRQTWPVARGRRRRVRRGAVRLLELHLGRAHRHRGRAAGHRRDRRLPARVAARRAAARRARQPGQPRGGGRGVPRPRRSSATSSARDDTKKDPPGEVFKAYAPYLIIIVVFAIAQLGPIKDALAKEPFTYEFDWPGLDIVNGDGEDADEPHLQLQLAAGGRHPDAHLRLHHDAGAEGQRQALAEGRRQDLRPAQVGDPHRGRGAGAGLRDEPVGPDHHHRPLGGRARGVSSRSSRPS